MRRLAFDFAGGLAVVLAMAAVAPGARAELDSSKCLKQIHNATRDSVDCVVAGGLDKEHKDRLSKATQGVIVDARCTVPITFRKAPIYADVVKGTDVNLPTLKVSCEISGKSSDEPARASAVLKPKCARKGKTWDCVANVGNLEGMGMLGGLLEKLANDSDTVKRAMAKFMAELDRAARTNLAKAPDPSKREDPKK